MTFLKGETMTLPVSAHLSIIRKALERERGMRGRVLRDKARSAGVSEMDQCLLGLAEIEGEIDRLRESVSRLNQPRDE